MLFRSTEGGERIEMGTVGSHRRVASRSHGHVPHFDLSEGTPAPPSPSFSLVMSTLVDLEFTDLSDLTELSSDDEIGPSIAGGSKGKQPAKDSFVLKNTLRPPRSVSYTTKWLHGAGNLLALERLTQCSISSRSVDLAAHRPRPRISGNLARNQRTLPSQLFFSVMSFGRRRNKWA